MKVFLQEMKVEKYFYSRSDRYKLPPYYKSYADLEILTNRAPLKTGTCDTCSAEKVKLRPNPFTEKQQCEECRNAAIIGVTDLKTKHKLKEEDLEGLTMVTEPQLAHLGGPDRRWYLVEEVEKRAEEKREEEETADKENGDVKKKPAKVVKRKKDEGAEAEDTADPPAKRGRGRPPKAGGKAKPEAKAKTTVAKVDEDGNPKRGRGRPPKAKVAEA
ncbi:hypothetical protein LSUE1_G008313 [Lachnellula suecica]|uniref:Uncharacterized protein n=1 Tax=Lachnellula suecica TaxID=602035 RepID=A0A8T9BYL1_9HELO|nr:hypothetical protein LSUE1_G008313 [Lachnellula suecica]